VIYKKLLKKAQLKASKQISKRLQQYGIALLWGQVRAGKTRSFLHASLGYRTLVVTKKDAIDGILSEAKELNLEVDVINYHSLHKVSKDNNYQLIIFDEAHLYISPSQPKAPAIWLKAKQLSDRKFTIFASGTPTSEGYGGLYWMLRLSTWTPFKYKRFTDFFKDYGIPSTIYTSTREVPSYKKTKSDKIKNAISHLVVTLKRSDTGHKYEVIDQDHFIKTTKEQSKMLKKINGKDRLCVKDNVEILADTGAKLLSKNHQISSGIFVYGEKLIKPNPKFVKVKKKIRKKFTTDEIIAYEKSKMILVDNLYYFKKVSPKVDYILKNFDVDKTIILSYYVPEQEYLAKIFPHTGSVTKMSTGKDLSMYETMIVFSMSFSASNYEQVRGRLMNVARKTQMVCHYLICGYDNYVLEAVRAKEDFTYSWYRKRIK